jgi:hypothetical protein
MKSCSRRGGRPQWRWPGWHNGATNASASLCAQAGLDALEDGARRCLRRPGPTWRCCWSRSTCRRDEPVSFCRGFRADPATSTVWSRDPRVGAFDNEDPTSAQNESRLGAQSSRAGSPGHSLGCLAFPTSAPARSEDHCPHASVLHHDGPEPWACKWAEGVPRRRVWADRHDHARLREFPVGQLARTSCASGSMTTGTRASAARLPAVSSGGALSHADRPDRSRGARCSGRGVLADRSGRSLPATSMPGWVSARPAARRNGRPCLGAPQPGRDSFPLLAGLHVVSTSRRGHVAGSAGDGNCSTA